MLSPRVTTFFVCSEVSPFHVVVMDRLLLSFFDDWFYLFCSWIDVHELPQLCFSSLIFLFDDFAYNIFTICVVTNNSFTSFELFSAFFDWFCNFCNQQSWIIYFCTDQIDIFWGIFNWNLVPTTRRGIVRVVL